MTDSDKTAYAYSKQKQAHHLDEANHPIITLRPDYEIEKAVKLHSML